jgi:hypothetical protein
MAGFRVQKLTASAVVIDDLGITLTGAISAIVDITDHAPENLARSADLLAAITADDILIVDPRDDTNATILTKAESTAAVNRSNDTHFGISGGRFGAVDDPTVTPGADFIIQYNSTGDAAEYIDPADFMSDQSASIGAIVGAMGQDGTDTTFSYNASSFPLIAGQNETNYDASTNNGTFAGTATAGAYVIGDVITMSDGSTVTVDAVSTGDITDFTVTTSSGANITAGVPLTQASVLPANGQTGFTITPEQNNISQGTLQWDVDDSFLRNTGDILDSGTLQIASGAALDLPTGSTITIAGDVTEASIQTPAAGFTNDDDLINKEYVDSLAGGFDYKESVRVATVASLGGVINAQTEVDYDGAGSNGTIAGGTLHAISDSVTFSDGTVILVDNVAAGVITEFTVTTAGSGNTAGQVLTQTGTTGSGINATLTLGTNNIGGVYDPAGGTATSGEFTGVDLSAGTGVTIDGLNFTGVVGTGLIIGDRVLIKDQADATQNGIYVIGAGSVDTSVILTRSEDMDGDPSSEVSGGNTTYVEDTTVINGATVNSNSRWSVVWDGDVDLNVDPVNWTQTGSGSISIAGIGLSASGATIDLDVDDLTTATAVATDVIAFHDADGGAQPSGSQTRKSTFQSVFNELDVPNNITSNGFIVRTADDTYAARSIAVNGGGPLDGLAVANGDGVSANPTIGLDIQNLGLRAAVDGVNDRVAVWDSTANANVYYTVNDIAGAASASNSFETWTAAGNSTGDASIVADSATDVVTVTGGIGINVDLTAASDIISWSFSRAGMADTAVVLADTIPFFDASNANEPEYRSWTNIIGDLGLITGISAATAEDLLGIDVTGTVIGLDILGLTAAGDDMAATDEFALHDKSEGTLGANGKITGTNIAEGTAAILGITSLTFDTFTAVTTPAEDQILLAYTDAVRSKVLSVESHTFQWADNKIKDNDWIKVGSAGDADSGWVMPFNGTIVNVTAHTEDTGGGNTYALDLYIDAVDSGPVAILTGGANAQDTNPLLNIDFDAGEKLRVRADQTAGIGDMQDTTIALLVKWRS